MKKLMVLSALILTLGSFAKTTVETTANTAETESSATVTIKGEEAKKLMDYLGEVSKYSGNYVAQEAGMGKFYLSAPGVTCTALNMGHLEPEQRVAEKMYSCEISFGATGSINL